MAKLLPIRPRIGVGMGTCGAGNGAEGVYHAFAEAHRPPGPRHEARIGGMLRLLRAGAAGQRAAARPSAGDSAARAGLRRAAAFWTTWPPGSVTEGLALCKIEEWDHLTARVHLRQRLSQDSLVAGGPVLQAAEEDRAAQLRADQPGRYRRVHRHRRLSVALQGADRRQPRAGDRADQGLQTARTRRRGLPHRAQMGVPAQGRRPTGNTSSATRTKAIPART